MREFTVCEAPQRSEAWFAARLGRATSSRVDDLLALGKKGGESEGRKKYRLQLALERINGRSYERTFQSDAMLQGLEREADALGAYEAETGELVRRVGFLAHHTLMAGGSPDGIIGDFEAGVEVKCPLATTHLETLKTGAIELAYRRQMTHLLWLTHAAWWDFASYCPEFPDGLKLKVVRFTVTAAERTLHYEAVETFLAEVEREVGVIHRLRDPLSVSDALTAALAHEEGLLHA